MWKRVQCAARLSILGLAGIGAALAGAGPALGDGLVPVGHHVPRPPLAVEVWTDRPEEAVYYPGEPVAIHFSANDGCYVLVYDIDTEGRVRRLFPAPGDPGYVPGHQMITLPGPGAGFDYIVTGPSGIETIEVVASRIPLESWESAEEPWQGGDDDEEWGPPPREYFEGEDENEDDQDDQDQQDEQGDYDEGEWSEGIWRSPTQARVSGDPYLAIEQMNHRVLPPACTEDDYATDFVTFCVGRRVSYPRYACNDCHGPYPAFDPYLDACSVFRVEVNLGWYYPAPGWHGAPPPRVRPRYVYVRKDRVPDRYRHLKREWSGWDRAGIDHELKPMVKALRKPAQKESRVGYAPKLRQELRREQEVKTRPGKRPSDRAGRRKADELQTERLETQARKLAQLENERRSPRVEKERRAAPGADARRQPPGVEARRQSAWVENERRKAPQVDQRRQSAPVEIERRNPERAEKVRKASPPPRAEEKRAQVESERQKPEAPAKSERGRGHGKEKRDSSSGGNDGARKKR
jgi:hypothetical protein